MGSGGGGWRKRRRRGRAARRAVGGRPVAAHSNTSGRFRRSHGQENGSLTPFYTKTNLLPRQARDKHRENSKKTPVFSLGGQADLSEGSYDLKLVRKRPFLEPFRSLDKTGSGQT